jgi:hypothetical protein
LTSISDPDYSLFTGAYTPWSSCREPLRLNRPGPKALLFSTIFDPAAQPRSPNVVQINASTIIWSFLLSLWKHVVNMSFSSAFLQIGRFCAIQKARLHWLQSAEEAARRSRDADASGENRLRRFVKHVHLQKEGGARGLISDCN